jgi:hypothetical protein
MRSQESEKLYGAARGVELAVGWCPLAEWCLIHLPMIIVPHNLKVVVVISSFLNAASPRVQHLTQNGQ